MDKDRVDAMTSDLLTLLVAEKTGKNPFDLDINQVMDVIWKLRENGIEPVVVDPWASERDAMHEYGVTLTPIEEVSDADCVIVAVAHNEFRALSLANIKMFYKDVPEEEKVLIDVKGLYRIDDLRASGMRWWRL